MHKDGEGESEMEFSSPVARIPEADELTRPLQLEKILSERIRRQNGKCYLVSYSHMRVCHKFCWFFHVLANY